MKKTLAVLGIAILVLVADLLLVMGRHVGVAFKSKPSHNATLA